VKEVKCHWTVGVAADTMVGMESPITSLTIEGFKSIRSLRNFPLRPLNVLIGSNGSGKSNFIGVFRMVQEIHAMSPETADEWHEAVQRYVSRVSGANALLHMGKKTTTRIDVELQRQSGTQAGVSEITSSAFGFEATGVDQLRPDRRMSGTCDWRVYHFHDTSSTSPMKLTGDVNDNRYLRPDGANLAAFLYFLRQRHGASYNLIRRTVQRVAPFFDDFQLAPMQLNDRKIRLEWHHKNTESYFDAASLSDGTLRFIALTTLFLQPKQFRPSVILVDEPELGLHPYAISMLASLIKQCSKATQVIVSTQSPLLLDHFQPEDVLVADLVQAATVLTRLQSATLDAWLQEYSLGQLWEKNEFGGRPAAP